MNDYEYAGVGPGQRRIRRAIAGEGMVTPRHGVEIDHEGRTERLIPGRDRLAPEHPIVRRRPELFRVADASDSRTRAFLEEETRRRRTATRSRGAREPWRL